MKFRYDINALRAIAVIGVILFHFKVPQFGGGFSGVDVFFVISGYLMSRIVITDLERGTFSFGEFYNKRLKRIVPALLSLILVLTLLCFFFYFPEDYQTFQKNAVSSILFLSNIWFWKHSGYFNPSSETNMLLHTWSLSVEWQFYLLYPIALFILYKVLKTKNRVFAVIGLATVAGFIGGVKYTQINNNASFYLLPSRAWEMLAGGLAFFIEPFVQRFKWKNIVAVICYTAILVCFNQLDTKLPWPGKMTALPVTLTFLVLICNYNDFFLIKSRVVQFLGTISYSLYLWHWPVYVIAAYWGIKHSAVTVAVSIAVAVALAYISNRYIEARKHDNSKPIWIVAGGALVITCCLAYLPVNKILFKPEALKVTELIGSTGKARDKQFSDGCCFVNLGVKQPGDKKLNEDSCLAFSNTKKNILLIGDSHAAQYSQSLKEKLAPHNVNILQASATACLPLLQKNGAAKCFEIINYIYHDYLIKNKDKIDGVIISANWINTPDGNLEALEQNLENTLAYLKKYNIRVVILGQNETYTIPYPVVAARELQYNMVL
ncbi:acyltransferase family protein [Mucilaginibacter sp. PAMB04274]|uniref:acyltransferase family protein n=1 Tax=Mucilaginibacter sp. PAMB04274 TaxID=3138568 RepID=UPI0031F610A1